MNHFNILISRIAFVLMLVNCALWASAANDHAQMPRVAQHSVLRKVDGSKMPIGFSTKSKKHNRVTEKGKTLKLAPWVLIGGIVSFLLVFPLKFFYAFVVVGLATLIAGILALLQFRQNSDLKGRWMVWTGMALVVILGGFFGLVLYALSRW
ncbi:MAG: hypothetical protein IT258_01045 [Saprospiraceae bacterium]|nr:hypothetical protein [Saprospiraceae bacterium]